MIHPYHQATPTTQARRLSRKLLAYLACGSLWLGMQPVTMAEMDPPLPATPFVQEIPVSTDINLAREVKEAEPKPPLSGAVVLSESPEPLSLQSVPDENQTALPPSDKTGADASNNLPSAETSQTTASPSAPDNEISEPITLKGIQTMEVLRLGLPDLVKMVEVRNLDIGIANAQMEQARGYLKEAIGGLFPSIRFSSSMESFQGGEVFVGARPFDSTRFTLQPRLSADYQFSLGGKTFFQIKATKIQLKRLAQGKNRTLQTALLETLTQYFTLLRDNSAVAVARQALREADAQVKFNQSRFEAGFATRMDVVQSQALQAQRTSDVLKAENAREISAITLAAMLDMPIDVHIEPEDPSQEPIVLMSENYTLQQLLQMAVQNRPDVKELTLQIEEARARYGAVRSDLFPTVTMSTYYRAIGPQPDELDRSFQRFGSINVDVLRNMGLAVGSTMQVSKARIQESILNREKQLNEIQRTLAQAYQDAQLYRAQMKVAQQKVDAAFESYRLAGLRLRQGFGLNLEVVEAQKVLTDARQEYQTAVMNFNIAQVRLLNETGQLTPHNMLYKLQHEVARGKIDPQYVP